MKPFRITVHLGATEIDPPNADVEVVQNWLEGNLEHVTSMFEGHGHIYVDSRADGLIDVSVGFSVRGEFPLDVVDKFRFDLETLKPLSRGIDIAESATFRLHIFHCEGESIATFIRHDPETGDPIYSDGSPCDSRNGNK